MTDRLDLLRVALGEARPGLAVEFGVGSGDSLAVLAAERPGLTYGFDSFRGLPETWRPGFRIGRFACDPPEVDGAQLVVGLFQDTLSDWLATHPVDTIGFVHVDCDLYSSTAYVLGALGRLRAGTAVVFDELVGYPGWPNHEHRALLEWVADTGTRLRPIGHATEQAAYIVT